MKEVKLILLNFTLPILLAKNIQRRIKNYLTKWMQH